MTASTTKETPTSKRHPESELPPKKLAETSPETLTERSGRERDNYRDRMWSAAEARGVPIATILVTVIVAMAVIDLNVLVILLLWVLRTIILYGMAAGFIALLLSPAVRFVERSRIGHGSSVTVVFLSALALAAGIVYAFTTPLIHAVTHFAKSLPHLITQAEKGKGRIGRLLRRLHLTHFVKTNAPKIAHDITHSLASAQSFEVGKVVISTVIGFATIAVLSLFMLLESRNIRNGLLGLMSAERGARFMRVSSAVSRSVLRYMVGNVVTSIIAGIVVYIALLATGVSYPLLLAGWVALVDLLPLVGGLLAGVPVVILAFIHSAPAGIAVLIVFLIYQQIENHLLNPFIMSRAIRMNPLWVLLAVLIGATLGGKLGTGLGGFVGALTGIPIGGALQVVVLEVRRGPGAISSSG